MAALMRLQPQPPAVHGSTPGALIDLSASLNPLGPSPAALRAARECELGHYPEVDAGSLRHAAAERHRLLEETVVPMPGASWAVWLCAVGLLRPGDRGIALAPCFGEYRRAVGVAGGRYREAGSEMDLESGLGQGAALCLIGNPANPTGTAIPAERIRGLCARHPNTRFLVDEAFVPFVLQGGISLLEGEIPINAIVVRSLTKELGLPGLRMGYLVAEPELATTLAACLPSWPLDAPAIAAAVAGMGDTEHLAAGAILAAEHIARLAQTLRQVDKRVLPSAANYLLAYAPEAVLALASHGIAVRDCASFGLPGHIRLAAPRPEHLATVLAAIEALP